MWDFLVKIFKISKIRFGEKVCFQHPNSLAIGSERVLLRIRWYRRTKTPFGPRPPSFCRSEMMDMRPQKGIEVRGAKTHPSFCRFRLLGGLGPRISPDGGSFCIISSAYSPNWGQFFVISGRIQAETYLYSSLSHATALRSHDFCFNFSDSREHFDAV